MIATPFVSHWCKQTPLAVYDSCGDASQAYIYTHACIKRADLGHTNKCCRFRLCRCICILCDINPLRLGMG